MGTVLFLLFFLFLILLTKIIRKLARFSNIELSSRVDFSFVLRVERERERKDDSQKTSVNDRVSRNR